jgi:AAA domain, putative AbiEii toxin, Type IV TA system
MRIERFHIHGFKSVADVEVDGLTPFNIFLGLNDTGRSNVFQALAFWSWLLGQAKSPEGQLSLLPPEQLIPWETLEAKFGLPLFHPGGDNTVRLRVEVVLDHAEWRGTDESSSFAATALRHPPCTGEGLPQAISDGDRRTTAGREIVAQLSAHCDAVDTVRVVSEAGLRLHPKGLLCQTRSRAHAGDRPLDLSDNALSVLLARFLLIRAGRHFHVERKAAERQEMQGGVGDHNLRQALLDAEMGHNPWQKRRLAMLKRLLNTLPFAVGEMDVTLDPVTDRIDIGFVGSRGWLPLESIGNGAQHLLLVLGQILLNDYPVVAIEEPEASLSPQYQQHLLLTLRRLIQDPQVGLSQVLITTHSPYFEGEDYFYEVTLDEKGFTRVNRQPASARAHYFSNTRLGSDAGSRLNAFNQVTLSDGIIKDLGLKYGDLVAFTRNTTGHWELRTEERHRQLSQRTPL